MKVPLLLLLKQQAAQQAAHQQLTTQPPPFANPPWAESKSASALLQVPLATEASASHANDFYSPPPGLLHFANADGDAAWDGGFGYGSADVVKEWCLRRFGGSGIAGILAGSAAIIAACLWLRWCLMGCWRSSTQTDAHSALLRGCAWAPPPPMPGGKELKTPVQLDYDNPFHDDGLLKKLDELEQLMHSLRKLDPELGITHEEDFSTDSATSNDPDEVRSVIVSDAAGGQTPASTPRLSACPADEQQLPSKSAGHVEEAAPHGVRRADVDVKDAEFSAVPAEGCGAVAANPMVPKILGFPLHAAPEPPSPAPEDHAALDQSESALVGVESLSRALAQSIEDSNASSEVDSVEGLGKVRALAQQIEEWVQHQNAAVAAAVPGTPRSRAETEGLATFRSDASSSIFSRANLPSTVLAGGAAVAAASPPNVLAGGAAVAAASRPDSEAELLM